MEKNKMIKAISKEISYVEASNDPLSADIGIIDSSAGIWLYDVGKDPNSIASLKDRYNVVLSHFHSDHTGNLDLPDIDKLYVSKYTYKHIGQGIVVDDDLYVADLHIFPLPSSHTKGALGLEVKGEFAFIGDAMYSQVKGEYYVYNVQLLKEEIQTLKNLKAKFLLISHRKGLIMPKDQAIKQLEGIYAKRDKTSDEIYINKII